MTNRMTGLAVVVVATVAWVGAPVALVTFDHEYKEYARLLERYVHPPGVRYAALKTDRALLDRVVQQFDAPSAHGERAWTRAEQMAFWINAYNVFTLRAIVDHYPIESGWLTRQPRNSIRQIDGVWTDLTFRAAGRTVTLDDIEHRILRPEFKDARIHFAVNCASVSCPVLSDEPYRPETLEAQLDTATRAYLASVEGVRVDGRTLRVTSLFDWYGDDFIAEYAPLVDGTRAAKERAILGVILTHGPPAAAAAARGPSPRIAFLDYNWALNEVR